MSEDKITESISSTMLEEDECLLTADEILEAEDLDYKYLKVPAWKGKIKIQQLSAQEALDFLDSVKGPARKNAQVRIIQLSAVTEDGEKLFTTKQLEALRRKGLKTLNEVANECLILSGLNKDTDVAEEAGNE